MTDTQLGVIVTAIVGLTTAIGSFLRWGFLQWMADRKEEREERKEEREARKGELLVLLDKLNDIQLTQAAMLERDRVREERRRRETGQAPNRGPSPWSEGDGQTTNVDEIKSNLRDKQQQQQPRKTPAMGVRPSRPGSHHDGDR